MKSSRGLIHFRNLSLDQGGTQGIISGGRRERGWGEGCPVYALQARAARSSRARNCSQEPTVFLTGWHHQETEHLQETSQLPLSAVLVCDEECGISQPECGSQGKYRVTSLQVWSKLSKKF